MGIICYLTMNVKGEERVYHISEEDKTIYQKGLNELKEFCLQKSHKVLPTQELMEKLYRIDMELCPINDRMNKTVIKFSFSSKSK